ncbi:hypothetical protein AYI68_g3851 [Smittium mucronatum]|uniref:Uncharacterized protein n=1 Tax=Smittium mucronatum TaxID=133383 RepID=A0A1R0GYS4_9FUNG|nr:hypothetical protein AYI68_g3851 [Smittium mucronatum]
MSDKLFNISDPHFTTEKKILKNKEPLTASTRYCPLVSTVSGLKRSHQLNLTPSPGRSPTNRMSKNNLAEKYQVKPSFLTDSETAIGKLVLTSTCQKEQEYTVWLTSNET